jgi:hypothetical protein
VYYGADGCDDLECTSTLGHYKIDFLGSLTAMGDLDNNGLDEIILGAPFGDGPSNLCPDCGDIYVVFDADTIATPIAPHTRVTRTAMLPAFPNPFSDSTTFRFSADEETQVRLTIYDVSGRRVAEPLTNRIVSAGEQRIRWDGRGDGGRALGSGIYFAKLQVGNQSFSSKVLLVR